MGDLETDHIRVLIANERKDRRALVAPIHPLRQRRAPMTRRTWPPTIPRISPYRADGTGKGHRAIERAVRESRRVVLTANLACLKPELHICQDQRPRPVGR
jgi:hypothetical protein